MDDILITGNNKSLIQKVISQLHDKFALKELGNLGYLLGIEVTKNKGGMFLCQKKYAQDLLKKAGLDDCKRRPTPSSLRRENYTQEYMPNPDHYRSIVGSL